MVAEPDSIPSEKRISLLHKEQIIDKNSMIQMYLDTYEGMTTLKQNLDIPVSEMMKQRSSPRKDYNSVLRSKSVTATLYLETDLNDYMMSLWKQFKIRQTRQETLGREWMRIR